MRLDKKAKIAVTGGAGYIGSFTVEYLKKRGFENLVILDNFSTGHKSVCFSRYLEVDLLDSEKLNEIFEKERFDAVIHFASLIVVPHSQRDPYHYFHHNINSSLNLLETMRKHDVKHIVFSSSCAVYGAPQKLPISEKESIKPQSVYAETKWMIERVIEWYSQIYGIRYALLRYFNACGASEQTSNGEMHNPETHLIPCAINNLLKKKPVVVYGKDYETKDGTCIRDYIHVDDLANAHHLALQYIMEHDRSDVFNLGVGRGYTNLEVVQTILEVTKAYSIDGSIEYRSRREGDVPILYADNAKARRVLGWEPAHTDMKKTVEEAFAWHQKKFKTKNSK